MKPVLPQPATADTRVEAGRGAALRWWKVLPLFVLTICIGTLGAKAQTSSESSQASAINPGEAANRKALEKQAGKTAAKLMLRSNPDKSSVLIDGKPVGKTPLLLIVHPGVYVVEMEGGTRIGYSRRQVDLLPKETREVMLELQPRYPASKNVSWASH